MHERIPPRPAGRRRTTTLAAVLLVVAVLAGVVASAAGGASGTDGAAGAAGGEAATPTGEVVEVTAVDYAFEGLPDQVAPETRLALRNASSAEAHELIAVRLDDDEDRSVEELAALPPAELAQAGEVVGVQIAAPAGGDVAVVAGSDVLLEPGRYALVCTIPIGADPELATRGAPAGGGHPHASAGMHAQVVVS